MASTEPVPVTSVRVRGERRPPPEAEGLHQPHAGQVADGFSYRVVETVAPGTGRTATLTVSLDLEESEILEVEDADGVVTFHSPASLGRGDLSDALAGTGTRSGKEAIARVSKARLEVPSHVAAAAGVVHASIPDDATRFEQRRTFGSEAHQAMREVVDWVERPLTEEEHAAADERVRGTRPKPHGLYRLGPGVRIAPEQRIDHRRPLASSDEPFLLLIHGTLSHTEATFGDLRGRPEWERLASRYGDRVLALEHPTLGADPVENAGEAARYLPDGATLHLLSHGRGGLVGDVLSLAAHGGPVVEAYGPAGATLVETVRRRGLTVARYARVACPASGSTLVTRRLDTYATILLNLLRIAPPGAGENEMVQRLLLALLDRRSDPRLVPGLEAMVPGSHLVRLLATAPPIDDGLGVVAGRVEGDGPAERIERLAGGLQRRGDHDLVVTTASMDGGAPRSRAFRAVFGGPALSHWGYFSSEPSRRAVCTWLESVDGAVPGFAASSPRTWRVRSSRDPASRGPGSAGPTTDGVTSGEQGVHQPVVVIPDVFGSCLVGEDGAAVWPDVAALARSGLPDAIGDEVHRVPDALVAAYDPLIEALGASWAVHPFPYDWRAPFEVAAEDLVKAIDDLARTPGTPAPIHIVTHGAGALVLIEALRMHPDLLERAGPVGRVVLLSPPLDGSGRPAALVEGVGELPVLLNLVDPATSPAGLAKVFGAYPSLQRLTRSTPTDGLLEEAVAVYGAAAPTPLVDAGGVRLTDAGDGNVTFPPPVRPGLRSLFSAVPSAAMPADPDLVSDVAALLSGGVTRHLSEARDAADPTTRPVEALDGALAFPDSDALVTAALGGRPEARSDAGPEPLRVSVTHGDLVHTDLPLVVGVYEGTPIRGAEGALDRRMGGMLQTRVALGRFPGPAGTIDVVGSPVPGSPQAVVIGMGHNGDLTSPRLATWVHQALLALAADRLERGAHGPIRVAAVLIGTTGAVSLPVAGSVSAIVTGALRANRRLRETDQPVTIAELVFVELYEDRAIEAVTAARSLPSDLQLSGDERLEVERLLQVGKDGLPGQPPPDYHRDRWRTIRVGVTSPDATSADPHRRFADPLGIQFTSIGLGSGAQQRVSVSQRRLVDALIAQAIENPAVDRQTYNTLYELLVPDGLKGQTKETENLLYVLDEAASTIPFEMLSPRPDDAGVEPFAVDVGMLRQLETSSFRDNVRPAAGHRALVIGDPPTTLFERLPGAIAEARKVQAVLEGHGYAVEALVPTSVEDRDSVDFVKIMNALFRHDYRIIHVAAHGTYDPDVPEQSGIVIGDDQFLTALEIRQMQTTPDLVFLNACHVGSMVPRRSLVDADDRPQGAPGSWRPDRLAASISRQLIDNGIRAVVAAGWAVADAAASDFAAHLYDRLLGGSDLGTAARLARRAVYHAHRHVNTWGAYQVYGQPVFRLDRMDPHPPPAPPVVSRKQLTERLERLLHDADRADTAERVAAIARSLDETLAGAAGSWLGGEQRSLAGQVAFQLGDYAAAVDHLGHAVQDWGAEAPLRAVEQLINARVKLALERRDHTVSDLLGSARELLDHLTGLGITPERSGIHGSFWRRQLVLSGSDGAIATRREALDAALDAYRRGWATAAARGRDDFYLGPNLVLLLWADGSGDRQAMAEILVRSRAAADAATGFWASVTPADIALVEALVDDALADRQGAVAAAYRQALAGGSSRMQRRAVAEHLEVVEAAVPADRPGVRQAVAELRSELGPHLA